MDNREEYISLNEAEKLSKYSHEYLRLRARKGKLKAKKFGRNWVTKKEWLAEYIAKSEEYKKEVREKRKRRTEKELVSKKIPLKAIKRPIRHSLSSKSRLLAFQFAVSFVLAFILVFSSLAFGLSSRNTAQVIFGTKEFVGESLEQVINDTCGVMLFVEDKISEDEIYSAAVYETADIFASFGNWLFVDSSFGMYLASVKEMYLALDDYLNEKYVFLGDMMLDGHDYVVDFFNKEEIYVVQEEENVGTGDIVITQSPPESPGPQGEKGDKGDKGDKGNKGDVGPAGPRGYSGTSGGYQVSYASAPSQVDFSGNFDQINVNHSKLTISSSGNLYTVGSVDVTGSGTFSRVNIDSSASYIDTDSSNITFTDSITGTKTLAELAAGGSPAGSDGQFQYNDSGSLGAADLYWDDSTNNLGLGDDSPDYKFEILDTVTPQFAISYEDGSVYGTIEINDSGALVFADQVSGRRTLAQLASGGAVAGGSNGQIQYNNSDSFSGAAQFFWDNSNNALGLWDSTPDAVLEISTPTSGVTAQTLFSISDNADGDMFIVDSSGNVGIGIASPSYLLDVAGIASVDSLNINDVYSLPNYDGISGDFLKTDGIGNLTWSAGSTFTPTDIDTDYGNETVTSTWNFIDNGTGAFGAYDLQVGDTTTPDYGALQIGQSGIYKASFSNSNLDLGLAMVFRQEGNLTAGNDPGIEFAFMESGNTIRLAIPESGAGNATAFIRSGTFAGPYSAAIGNDIVLCDQWTSYDSNIDCDTSGTGADLFVQDDFELEGEIFSSGTIHLDADDANQHIIAATNQSATHNFTFPDDEIADVDLIIGNGAGTFGYVQMSGDCTINNSGVIDCTTEASDMASEDFGHFTCNGASCSIDSDFILAVATLNVNSTYSLPNYDGGSGEYLKTDGNGNLTWDSVAGSGDVTAVGDCEGSDCFTGTSGTQLTFDNVGGDGILSYDGTFSFDKLLSVVTLSINSAYDLPNYDGSSSEFLKTDGNGNLTWAVAGGTAAGSDGMIQYNDGGSSFGGATQFFWNDTTNTLGLWDSTPDAVLEISTPTSGVTALDLFSISDNADGDIFIVDSSGNVGIGDSTPNNTIQVAGLINFDDTRYNTSLGKSAGNALTTGQYNTAVGHQALLVSQTSSYNSAFGYRALYTNTTGYSNVALGSNSLFYNTTGYINIALGESSLFSNTTGYENIALGAASLFSNIGGYENTALGYMSLYDNTAGYYNIALGSYSLMSNTTGIGNTAIGYGAGDNITTGDYNIMIGYDVDVPSATANYQLNIGNTLYGDLTNGLIGINSSTPSALLEIATYGGSDAFLQLSNISHGDILTIDSFGSVGLGDTTPDSTLEIVSSNNQPAFMVSSTEAGDGDLFIIDNSGNVGIGTDSPSYNIHVTGTAYLGGFLVSGSTGVAAILRSSRGNIGTTSSEGFTAINYNLATAGVPVQMSPRLAFTGAAWNTGSSASNTSSWIIENLPSSGDPPTSFLRFGHSLAGVAYSYPMVLRETGQLGIGDTDPDAMLEIATPTGETNYLMLTSSSDGDVLIIDSSGNVGIGDSTPSYLLDVAGIASVDSLNVNDAYDLPNYDGTNNQYLKTDGGGNLTWATVAGSGDVTAVGDCEGPDCFTGSGDTSTQLTFDDAGGDGTLDYNGTFSFNQPLSVVSLSVNSAYDLPNYDGTINQYLQTDGGGNLTWNTVSGSSAAGLDGQVQYNDGGSFGGSGQLYYDDSTHRLGLYESSPAAILEIASSSGVDYLNITSSPTSGDILTIDSLGNVGIGDSTPNATLEVVSGVTGGAAFMVSSTDSGDGDLFIIDGSGNVGIGTSPLSTYVLSLGASPLSINASGGIDSTSYIRSLGSYISSRRNNIITTSTDAFLAHNDFSSTSGSPVQISPRIRFSGTAWDTGSSSSKTTNWIMENMPISGNPTSSRFDISADPGTGSYTKIMSMTSGGNVGISTTDPNALLEIASATGDFLNLSNVTHGDLLTIDSSGNVGIGDTTPDSTLEIVSFNNQPAFMVSSTEAGDGDLFIIDGSGNVGIGTVSPDGSLHVANDLYNYIIGNQDGSLMDLYHATTPPSIRFTRGTPGVGSGATIAFQESSGRYKLRIGNKDSASQFKIDIPNSGQHGLFFNRYNAQVGAGTAPVALVEFGDSSTNTLTANRTTSELLIRRDVDGSSSFSESSAMLKLERVTTNLTAETGSYILADDKLILDKDGNLGIGITSPDALLEVASTNGDFLNLSNVTHGDLLTIDSSGNVGIGDSTPSYLLDVAGIASVDSLNVNDTYSLPNYDGGSGEYLKTDGNGNLTWASVAGSGDVTAVGDCGGSDCFTGDSGTQLTFDNVGGDGILSYNGTFSFDKSLSVVSLSVNSAYDLPNYDGINEQYLQTDGNGNLTWATVSASAEASGSQYQVQFNADGTNFGGASQLWWNSSSNTLGLWDSTPDAVLEISTPTSGVTAQTLFSISDNADGDIFIVDSSGNVGIGDSTPNNKIQVAGLINFDDTRYNTSLGYNAGAALTTIGGDSANYNTAVGYQALLNTATSDNNSAFGYRALPANTTGYNNTALGSSSLYYNTTGNNNTAAGYASLYYNTTGYRNTASGYSSLFYNTTGRENTASGYHSLYSNTTGRGNTASGFVSLQANTVGQYNSVLGYEALYTNVTGSYNNAFGYRALYNQTDGTGNIGIGYQAGDNITTGDYNIIIGYDVDAPSTTANYQLNIGNTLYGDLSNGLLGINDTIPSAVLEIASVSGYDYLNITTVVGGDVFTVDLSGNVGIGDSTPSYLLDVAGIASVNTLNVNDTYSLPNYDGINDQYLQTDGNGNLTWDTVSAGATPAGSIGQVQYNLDDSNLGGAYLYYDDTNRLLGLNSSTPSALIEIATYGGSDAFLHLSNISHGDILVVDSSGNMGIGDATPSYRLDVYGIASVDTLNVNDTYALPNYDGTNNQYLKTDGGGNLTWDTISTDAAGSDGQIQYNNGTAFGGAAQLYYDDASGFVGIGDNVPEAVLEITSLGGSNAYLYVTNVVDGDIFTISSSGNVGIGDVSPEYPLEVLSTVTSQLTLTYADNTAYTMFYTDSSGDLNITPSSRRVDFPNDTTFGSATEGDIYFFDGDTLGENFEIRIYGYVTEATGATFAALNMDDANNNFIIDVADGNGSTVLNTAIRLDDAGGVSNFRVLDSGSNVVFNVDSYGIVTMYYDDTTAPTLSNPGDIAIARIGGSNRIYFQTYTGLHYVIADAGFEVPTHERNDPITGERIEVGDFVLGVIDKDMGDGSGHGLWARWETVKEQLMSEIYANLSMGGLLASSTDGTNNTFVLPENNTPVSSSGLSALLDPFVGQVKKALSYLGVVVENGVASFKGIFAEKVVTNEIELIDKATGERYCTWIENGEWIKQKGECSSFEDNQELVPSEQNVTEPLVRHYCDEGYAEECIDPDSCRAAGLYWYEGDCHYEDILPEPEVVEPIIEESILETETPANQESVITD